MTDEFEQHDRMPEADEAILHRTLDDYGRSARDRDGLEQRLYSASVEHLTASTAPIPFTPTPSRAVVWSRLALAACVLLAFAVSIQILMTPTTNQLGPGLQAPTIAALDAPDSSGLPDDLELGTDRETVLFALLDAGDTGQIDIVDQLEGSDRYGIAFAPILGTTGFELTDFAEEIQSIEGSMRR